MGLRVLCLSVFSDGSQGCRLGLPSGFFGGLVVADRFHNPGFPGV